MMSSIRNMRVFVLVLLLLTSSPFARAQEGTEGGEAGSDVTQIFFGGSSADQSFTVPEGVTSITVHMWGAGGGSSSPNNGGFGRGGNGGYVSGTFSVTQGDTYTIIVGEGTRDASCISGNGGGASALLLDGNYIAVAGGGGGGYGSSNNGGNAGAGGDAAAGATGGFGGTTTQPAWVSNILEGEGASTGPGQPTYGGGGACSITTGDAGGGSGYYGGQNGRGGGGGSNFLSTATDTANDHANSPDSTDNIENFFPEGTPIFGLGATVAASSGNNGAIVITHAPGCPSPPGLLDEQFNPVIIASESGLSLLNSNPIITFTVDLPKFYFDVQLGFDTQCGITCSASNNDCKLLTTDPSPVDSCLNRYTVSIDYVQHCTGFETATSEDGASITFSGDLYASAKVTLDEQFQGRNIIRDVSQPLPWFLDLRTQIELSTEITVTNACTCDDDAVCNNGSCNGCSCECDEGFTGPYCGTDNEDPVLTCPLDLTIELDKTGLDWSRLYDCDPNTVCTYVATDSYPVSVTDNQDDDKNIQIQRTFTYSGLVDSAKGADYTTTESTGISNGNDGLGLWSINFESLGVWTALYTATDAAGNDDTCTFTVTVLDKAPPTPQCPPDEEKKDVSEYDNSKSGIDLIDQSPDEVFSPTYPQDVEGPTTHTLTYTDDSGNSDNCTFTKTLDKTPPTMDNCSTDLADIDITVTDINLECAPYESSWSDDRTWTDTLTGVDLSSITSNIDSTLCLEHGQNQDIGTQTADDNVGNQGSCTLRADVVDQAPPIMTCPTTPNEYSIGTNASTYTGVELNTKYTAEEKMSTMLSQTFSAFNSVSGAYDITIGSSTSAYEWALGNTQVQFRACDNHNNCDTCLFTVSILDNYPPTVNCPQNFIMYAASDSCAYTPLGAADVNDADADATTSKWFAETTYRAYTYSDNIAVVFGNNNHEDLTPGTDLTLSSSKFFKLTVEDAAALTDSCQYEVTLSDLIDPTANCPTGPVLKTTDAGEDHLALSLSEASNIDNLVGYDDNCAVDSSGRTTPSVGTELNVGNHTFTYGVSDTSGNSDSCSFIVRVEDKENPTLVCTNKVFNVETEEGTASYTIDFVPSDNTEIAAGGPSYTVADTNLAATSTWNLGTVTVTGEVFDIYGNRAECTFTVTVNPVCGDGYTHGSEECDGGDDCGTDCLCASNHGPFDECNEPSCPWDCESEPCDTPTTNGGQCTVTVNTPNGEEYYLWYDLALANGLVANSNLIDTLKTSFNLQLKDGSGGLTETINGVAVVTVCCDSFASPAMFELDGTCADGAITYDSIGANADQSCTGQPNPSPRPFGTSGLCYDWDICTGGPFIVGDVPTQDHTCLPGNDQEFNFTGTPLTATWNDEDIYQLGNGYTQVNTLAEVLPGQRVYVSADQSSPYSITSASPATTTVTYTLNDGDGTPKTCGFTITVNDRVPPSITCANDAVNTDATKKYNTYSLATLKALVTGTDNTGAAITADQISIDNTGHTFASNAYTLNLDPTTNSQATHVFDVTVTGANGVTGTCLITITVSDNENPLVDCPNDQDYTTPVDQICYDYSKTVTAVDNALNSQQDAQTAQAIDECVLIGDKTYTPSFTDPSSNTDNTCSYTVTITDGKDPTFENCPADLTGTDALSWTSTSTLPNREWNTIDNCGTCDQDGCATTTSPANSFCHASASDVCYKKLDADDNETGDCLNVGASVPDYGRYKATVTVTDCDSDSETEECTASDSAECTWIVEYKDTNDPVVTCPADATTPTDANSDTITAIVSRLSATVTDVEDDLLGYTTSLSYTPSDATHTLKIGDSVTITVVATDNAGNTDSCSYELDVIDGRAPTPVCGDHQTCLPTADYSSPTSADNWDGTGEAGAPINSPAGVFASGTDQGASIGYGTTTATWSFTDAAGNTDTCTFNIVRNDCESPVISCPSNSDVGITETYSSHQEGDEEYPTATDNVSTPENIAISVVHPHADETALQGQLDIVGNTVTFTGTATDEAGYTDTCSWTVTVVDDDPPVVTCPNDKTDKIAESSTPATELAVTYPPATAVDDTTVTITYSHQSGDSFPLGDTTVTVVATDANNNNDTCTFTITVLGPYAYPELEAVLTAVNVVEDDDDTTEVVEYRVDVTLLTATPVPHHISRDTGRANTFDATAISTVSGLTESADPGTVCSYNDPYSSDFCEQTFTSSIALSGCDLSSMSDPIVYRVKATCQPNDCTLGEIPFDISITLSADNYCGENLGTVTLNGDLITLPSADLTTHISGLLDVNDMDTMPTDVTTFSNNDNIAALMKVTSDSALITVVEIFAADREHFDQTTGVSQGKLDFFIGNNQQASVVDTDERPNYAWWTWTESSVTLNQVFDTTVTVTAQVTYNLGTTVSGRRLLSLDMPELPKASTGVPAGLVNGRRLLQAPPPVSQKKSVTQSSTFVSFRLASNGRSSSYAGPAVTMLVTAVDPTNTLSAPEADTAVGASFAMTPCNVDYVISDQVADGHFAEVRADSVELDCLENLYLNSTSSLHTAAATNGIRFAPNMFYRGGFFGENGPVEGECTVVTTTSGGSNDDDKKYVTISGILFGVSAVGWCAVLFFARSKANDNKALEKKLDNVLSRSNSFENLAALKPRSDSQPNVVVLPPLFGNPDHSHVDVVKPKRPRSNSISPINSPMNSPINSPVHSEDEEEMAVKVRV